MRVQLILNRGGGSVRPATAERLRALFAARSAHVEIVEIESGDVERVCREVANLADNDVVVIAGGDGTVSAAAAALAGTGRALGIVPLGTLNHFARDAGIPVDPEQAVELICSGARRQVDVAEVNGRVFVNNSAVGLYPAMVRLREHAEARGGRRLALLRASFRALRAFKRRRLWISAEGLEAPVRTPLLFVGNNRYQVNLLALGRRESIDKGELCIYAVRARGRVHLFWAGIRGLFGKLDQQRDFLTAYGREAEIAANRPALTLSLDGETLTLPTPLRYRIRPGALTLIAPPAR